MTQFAKGPRAARRGHDWIDERSRALHARVAEKVRRNPGLISTALANLDRWEASSGPDRAISEWREILTRRPLNRVLALLVEDGEEADRLRQSTPFAGVLTAEERMEVLHAYEAL